MKIRHILWTVSVFTLAVCTSCESLLDKAPDGRISFDEIFSDHDNTAAFLNSCYRNIHTKNLGSYFLDNVPVGMSDDAFTSEEGRGDNINAKLYRGSVSAADHPATLFDHGAGTVQNSDHATFWSVYWQQIRYCNIFLDNIDEATVNTEEERTRWKAEAHVLRAFFYMELVKWYGKLPVVDYVFDIVSPELQGMERVSVAEVARFIEADCKVALDLSDNIMPWRITNPQEGIRVTKALAWALTAKAWLFAASPLHNEGENLWNKAYEVNRDAVNALRGKGYQLYTECQDKALYANLYGTKAAAYHEFVNTERDYSASPVDRETIYQLTDKGQHGANYWDVHWVSSTVGTFRVGNAPTQELVDAYEVVAPDGSASYPLLDLREPYMDDYHLVPNFNPDALAIYDDQDPYVNRDPRFYVTVLYNGAKYNWRGQQHTLETFAGGANGITNYSDRKFTRTGYIHHKFVPPVVAAGGAGQGSAPWRYYRLGELLLDYAEAAAEAGHLEEARIAANEVRDRVSMPEIPAGLSKENLLLRIKNERRVEMAYEETRYFDLRRWQTPDGDLSKTCRYLTGMWITRREDGTFLHQRRNILNRPRSGYKNRDLLLPLPVYESALIEGKENNPAWQNPGW